MAIYIADEAFDGSLLSGASCAFGVFDGLHKGHQFLIGEAVATKDGAAGRSIALTFDIDPDEVFRPASLKKLMANDERLEALSRSGVDDVVALRFTRSLYTKSPEDFLAATFSAGASSHLHVGVDFRFGTRASGTVHDLEAWGKGAGCAIHPHDLLVLNGAPVTATRIRSLLDCRDVRQAEFLLGR